MKAVIFDMDGVLIQSMKYHVISWRKALKPFNILATKEDLLLMEGLSYKETINKLSKKYQVTLSEKDIETIYENKKSILNNVSKLEIYTGVFSLLDLLKKHKMKLAVVTGSNKAFATKIIKKNFPGYFERIITESDVKRGKPNKESYVKVLGKLKVSSRDAVVIENAPLGIQSAKSAKITTYALETTLKKDKLRGADKIFANHKKLNEYFYKVLERK